MGWNTPNHGGEGGPRAGICPERVVGRDEGRAETGRLALSTQAFEHAGEDGVLAVDIVAELQHAAAVDP